MDDLRVHHNMGKIQRHGEHAQGKQPRQGPYPAPLPQLFQIQQRSNTQHHQKNIIQRMEPVREHIGRPSRASGDEKQVIRQFDPLDKHPDPAGKRIVKAIVARHCLVGHSQAQLAHQAVQGQKREAR